jgi:hypothetical protein
MSKTWPLGSPQMVEGAIKYALHPDVASAARMARSHSLCQADSGRVAMERRAGVLAVAGVGFKSV